MQDERVQLLVALSKRICDGDEEVWAAARKNEVELLQRNLNEFLANGVFSSEKIDDFLRSAFRGLGDSGTACDLIDMLPNIHGK